MSVSQEMMSQPDANWHALAIVSLHQERHSAFAIRSNPSVSAWIQTIADYFTAHPEVRSAAGTILRALYERLMESGSA